jgi:methylmalonyl-CoA/ethylmalonyl-CoA epimerase
LEKTFGPGAEVKYRINRPGIEEWQMAKVNRIDHIAIVVEDIDQSLIFWRDALGLPLTHIEHVPSQKAQVAFLPAQGCEVELVMPTEADTGVARFLEKRGPGMHHICFEVDDIEGCLQRLQELNIRLINEKPTIGSGGKRIAFIHPESTQGVLVELNEARAAAPVFSVFDVKALAGRAAVAAQVMAAASLAFVRALRGDKKTDLDHPAVVLEERSDDG